MKTAILLMAEMFGNGRYYKKLKHGAAEIGKACIKENIITQWEKTYDEEEDGGRDEFLKELDAEISRILSRRFIVRAVKLNAYGAPEVDYYD